MPRTPPVPAPEPSHPSRWSAGARRAAQTIGVPDDHNAYVQYGASYVAFQLYLHDRLDQAAQVLERGVQLPEGWIAQLVYTIGGELEARDFGRRVERSPFVFELPAGDAEALSVVDMAEHCAARVEKLLDAERPQTLFTLLPPDSLLGHTDMPHGYMVPKTPYFKVCLPWLGPEEDDEFAFGLIHEYTHVVANALSDSRTPRWFDEGLAQWAEYHLLGEGPPEPALLPGERPRLGHVEGLLHSLRSVDDEEVEFAYAAAYAAVCELMAWHSPYDVREFLVRLSREDEGRAFKAAFGQSPRQFERAWHERLKSQADT